MEFSLDRTGFPLVILEELGIETTLLPITKFQFEAFLSDPAQEFDNGLYGDDWYDEVLRLNERVCPSSFDADNLHCLFLTGIYPAEILPFANWLGDFKLPGIRDWRLIDRALERRKANKDQLLGLLSGESQTVVSRLYEQISPANLADLAMTLDGVIEWVHDGKQLKGMGRPRQQLHPNSYSPRLRRDEFWSLRTDERHLAAGARLFRRLNDPSRGAAA